MKVVNLSAFLVLPRGTLFSKYEPHVFGPLCIKEKTRPEALDFFYAQIADAVYLGDDGEPSLQMIDACRTGATVDVDLEHYCLDACFNADQMFAVWERAELESLLMRVAFALGTEAFAEDGREVMGDAGARLDLACEMGGRDARVS